MWSEEDNTWNTISKVSLVLLCTKIVPVDFLSLQEKMIVFFSATVYFYINTSCFVFEKKNNNNLVFIYHLFKTNCLFLKMKILYKWLKEFS